MSKEEMIIKDYVERFAPRIDGEKYWRLYEDQDPSIQKVYAYFHQQFNCLFEFLNQSSIGRLQKDKSTHILLVYLMPDRASVII